MQRPPPRHLRQVTNLHSRIADQDGWLLVPRADLKTPRVRRIVTPVIGGALLAALLPVLTIGAPASASSPVEVVVNIPSAPAPGLRVTVTPSGGAAVTTSDLYRNDYGSFGIAEVPATATDVAIALGSGAATTVSLKGRREFWLDADGKAHVSRVAAQGNVAVIRVRSAEAANVTLSVDSGAAMQRDAASTATEAVFRVPVSASTKKIALQPLVNGAAQGGARSLDVTKFGEAWLSTTWSGVRTSKAWADGFAIIHYQRPDKTYTDYVLHTWSNSRGGAEDPGWATGRKPDPSLTDAWGVAWKVPLLPDSTNLPYIIHKGDDKDLAKDQFLDLELTGGEVWFRSKSSDEEGNAVYAAPAVVSIDADLTLTKGFWIDASTIAWPNQVGSTGTLQLALAPSGGIRIVDGAIVGADEVITLTPGAGLSGLQAELNRHIRNYAAFSVPASVSTRVKDIVRGQVVLAQTGSDGLVTRASGVQLAPVLDEIYSLAAKASLGLTWIDGAPTVRVWAPTATTVSLLRYPDPTSASATETAMVRDQETGVWTAAGTREWANQYYLFKVSVFVPSEGKVVTNLVTDPYSVSLSTNSTRSQFVDLTTAAATPAGWATLRKPDFAGIKDATIYELMIRDHSVTDTTVPQNLRGTFGAFGVQGAAGAEHLRSLAAAGMTHLQLGPFFDFATTNEDRSTWQSPGDLSSLPRNSEEQQARITAIKDKDGFNWGYDPLHFNVPEGSFAVNPDGVSRVREARQMIADINGLGMRVVMDVVYNHTNASGQSPKSIFDRIVPGYYHRLNPDGTVTNSTCCANTASERVMFAKFIRDSIRLWAVDYKIDGFRFDLMGHHQKQLMVQLRADLDALTLAKDGVDGSKILLYGEGWNFGEVKDNARFVNATQLNLAGTGVGTFDDRLRDAVRGGGPFDGNPRRQGFASGLLTTPNGDRVNGSRGAQVAASNNFLDIIKLGLTGNLSQYQMVTSANDRAAGNTVLYNNSDPAAYTASPTEQIVYVDAHDNETLYDILAFKLPATTSMSDRVRHQVLAMAIPTLSQGLPFYLAGSELLRSKSLDKNSYDSGDWFNAIDWSKNSNGWGRGLPLRSDNAARWEFARPLLANPNLMPGKADIEASAARFQEFLRIRYSSELFRLGNAAEVNKRVRFLTAGSKQQPGLIVMQILDEGPGRKNIDAKAKSITVVFNATRATTKVSVRSLATSRVALHPIQQRSVDRVIRGASARAGVLTVPSLSVAVFVEQ